MDSETAKKRRSFPAESIDFPVRANIRILITIVPIVILDRGALDFPVRVNIRIKTIVQRCLKPALSFVHQTVNKLVHSGGLFFQSAANPQTVTRWALVGRSRDNLTLAGSGDLFGDDG